MTDAAINRTIVVLFDDPDGAIRAFIDLHKVGVGGAFTMLGNATAKAKVGLAGLNGAGEGFATNSEVIYDSASNRVSALTGSGVPESDAEIFAESVRRGNVVLIGRLHEDKVVLALDVIGKHQPVDVEERRRAYRDAGWFRYDAVAPDYDAVQVVEELARQRSTREAATAIGEHNAISSGTAESKRVHYYVIGER